MVLEAITPDKASIAQAVAAYLPESLVTQLLTQNPEVITKPNYFEAVTMMVDVTGFTPLCEALAKKGKEGAEQVTELINAFFTQALNCVQGQGGVIAKFGGDAFNAFFARNEGESWDAVSARALQSAFALQALVDDYAGLRVPATDGEGEQVFKLYVKVGVAGGLILTFSVGLPDSHRDFQAAGLPFNLAAEAEHHANRGEIIIHDELRYRLTHLKEFLEFGDQRVECCPVVAFRAGNNATASSLRRFEDYSDGQIEQFVAQAVNFLPTAIYERIKLGYLTVPGEHRRVISLFVNFRGLNWIEDWNAPANFQGYYQAISEEVEYYRGNLNRISSGDKGDLLHIIFGAPVTYQDDEEQAVRCALALQNIARKFPIIESQKIGLSSGFVFAGDIGSPYRHEYTVMGDTVNLSARLMQLADDWTIVLDAVTAHRLPQNFEFANSRAVPLKGKKGLTEICEVLRFSEGSPEKPKSEIDQIIIGRETELAEIEAIINTAMSGKGKVLAVTGEAGIGKSVLISHLSRHWQKENGIAHQASLLNYERGVFRLWAKWLAQIFDFASVDSLETRQQKLARTVQELLPQLAEWSPLWGELLDLNMPEAAWLRSLDRPTRRQRLVEYTPLLIAAAAKQRPLLLICDDFHWADSASLELLDQVVPHLQETKVLICLVYRTEQAPKLAILDTPQCKLLLLQALSTQASQELIITAIGNVTAEDEAKNRFIALVNEMAGGNPFFIEELISTLRVEKLLEVAIRGAGSATPLSYNLQSLIMARLDGLEGRLREIVLAASVVGGYFNNASIKPLLPSTVAQALEDNNFAPLQQLVQLDLLRLENAQTYRFRHALLQQVAYDSLPFARRRVLHEEVARYFEDGNSDDRLERVTYHYERSINHLKAVFYLAKSAERAARLYPKEAIQPYQTALVRAEQANAPTDPPIPQLLRRLGDAQATVDSKLALESYAQALESLPEDKALERGTIEQRRATVFKDATKFPEALEALELAEKELAQAKNRQKSKVKLAQAEIAELYSTIMLRLGKHQEALQWAEKGLALLDGSVMALEEGAIAKIKLYQAQAAVTAIQRKMDAAQQAVGKALRLIKRHENPLIESELRLRQAILLMQREEYRHAPLYFRQALEMIEKTKISRLISNVLLPGGQALIARGEFAEAQAWIERGLRLAEENGTPSPLLICTGYYLLAWVDKEIGEWDRAIERCKVSVEIAEKHQLWMRYIEFLVRQGELLAYQGDFVNAEQIIKQAISCADEHKLPDSAKFCYRYLSEVYYRQGLFNQAVEASKLGEPKFAQYNSNIAMYHLREAECYALSAFVGESCDGLATPQELIARAAQALKYLSGREMAEYLPVAYRINGFLAWVEEDNTGEALRCFSTGLKIARATNNLPETARLLVWRNRLRLLTNPTANSRAELIKAAELFERLKALPELNQVNQLLVGYYQSKKPPVPLGTDTPPHWTLST